MRHDHTITAAKNHVSAGCYVRGSLRTPSWAHARAACSNAAAAALSAARAAAAAAAAEMTFKA